jgi:thioesterase domain-containing protein
LTAERFFDNPFGRGRLYKTGDLGRYLPDGNVEYLGRIDHQVKIRGFRIELGEIEANLKQHPAVHQAVVVAYEESPDDRRLAAYVVMKDSLTAQPTSDDDGRDPAPSSATIVSTNLRAFLRDKLPDYMLPAAYIVMDALPLTPSGKIDRRALPKPDAVVQIHTEAYVAPGDIVERQLVTVWEDVLSVKPIGVRSNFFELGGHSLLAIELFARIEKIFGRRPPLTALFQAPTIEQLARVLRREGWSEETETLIPIQVGGTQTPFFCVHGFGGGVIDYGELARLLGPDQPFYGLQALGVDGVTAPHTQIEAMAAHYINAMRPVQPHGPYLLGGYCFGGVVAFEMARQLQAQGEQVGLVGVFEGYAPVRKITARSLLHPRKAFHFARNVPYWLRDYMALGRAEFLLRMRTRLRSVARHLVRIRGRSRERRLEDFLPDVSRVPLVHQRLMELELHAMSHYTPERYAGRVTLFRVRGMSLFRATDPEMGWGDLTQNGVEIRMIDGGHNTILEHPHVQSLAAQLQSELQAARSDRPLPGSGSEK